MPLKINDEPGDPLWILRQHEINGLIYQAVLTILNEEIDIGYTNKVLAEHIELEAEILLERGKV